MKAHEIRSTFTAINSWLLSRFVEGDSEKTVTHQTCIEYLNDLANVAHKEKISSKIERPKYTQQSLIETRPY